MRRLLVRLGYFLLCRNLIPGTLLGLARDVADRDLLKVLLEQLGIDCVFDVGAHTGGFATSLRRLGYRGHIVSFEPAPGVFAVLQNRFRGDALWQGYNCALGAEDTRMDLNVAELSNCSSFLRPKGFDVKETIEVEVRRLDGVFGSLVASIPEPRVFLKLDTQGYDLEVLKGAQGCLDRILGLQSEISVEALYEGMPDYLDSLAQYNAQGFTLANLCTAARNNRTKRVIEYDCLMVHDQTAPSATAEVVSSIQRDAVREQDRVR
ncbi:MAG: FkbM family methyltransferase [Pirellulales bacterium]|nr:FkbM family methyltransferase [Pirellulales bacterium]